MKIFKQFLFGDGEMHLKPLESTSMHENYEEEDEEVEHEGNFTNY